MWTTTNTTFQQLLTEYDLPSDLSFSIDLPNEVQKILDDQILITRYGITLKSFNRLYKAKEEWENQSIIEDDENHFHVDWHIEPPDEKNAFMLGVKTLQMLADKFNRENIKGIRFWYSFQTPELGEIWARQNNLYKEGVEYLISDRLSFYTRRDNEVVISYEQIENRYSAMLIIDI